MNICLLGQFPPHLGGVSSHNYLLAKELKKRGDNVVVLTYSHAKLKDIEGIKVISAWTPNIKGLRGLIFIISAFIKLWSLNRKYDFDIIHAHYTLPPGLIAVMVGGLTKKKTAITMHGSDILIQAQKPILRNLIKAILKRANYLLSINETIREKVIDLGIDPNKIYLTNNAVDLNKFRPQQLPPDDLDLKSDYTILLFVGNLVAQKGLSYLLDAKKLMKNKSRLLIVGDGPLRSTLINKVESESIKNVEFIGARHDVEKIMPSADLLVLSSISEGSPITLLEAMASGIPVVATCVGGIPSLVTNKVGRLVEPKNSIELGQVLDEMVDNQDLRSKMGKEGRKLAGKYGEIKIPY